MVLTSRSRIFIFIMLLFASLVVLNMTQTPGNLKIDHDWETSKNLKCHGIEGSESLPDISDHPPSPDKRNIFFLETSCKSHDNGKIEVNARQACAVESAARMNPDMDVYFLFASPGTIKDEGTESDRILKVLESYSNIKIMYFNMKRYVQGTPVEELWTSGRVKESQYPISHSSDVLRFLTLWKYGGIYMDLDTIVVKTLSTLPDNFVGIEEGYLGSAVLGFSNHGNGRMFLEKFLDELKKNFDAQEWGNNGPQLITRMVFSQCSEFDSHMLLRFGSCEDLRLLPPSAFYLIPYNIWKWYFEDKHSEAIRSFVEQSSYVVHLWNKLSFEIKIPKTSTRVPYLNLASTYCPKIVKELDEYF